MKRNIITIIHNISLILFLLQPFLSDLFLILSILIFFLLFSFNFYIQETSFYSIISHKHSTCFFGQLQSHSHTQIHFVVEFSMAVDPKLRKKLSQQLSIKEITVSHFFWIRYPYNRLSQKKSFLCLTAIDPGISKQCLFYISQKNVFVRV